MDSPGGASAKLRRAREHTGDLERDLSRYVNADTYPVEVVTGSSEFERVVRVLSAPEIPCERWALMIGDAVHNLRSALDHVVWQLAGADPTDSPTMFPFSDDLHRYASEAKLRRKKRSPKGCCDN
jgi:hypothetical protein